MRPHQSEGKGSRMKRIEPEDVTVPTYAHDVPGGYPTHAWEQIDWPLVIHVYAPIMPSPRPRVTRRGTFMPTEYRQHCDRLAASLAYARGLLEGGAFGTCETWDASRPMEIDLAFWAARKPGDLDNLEKTVLDAGQLHRGEAPGAELWANDSQIIKLASEWIPTDEPEWHQTVIRVRYLGADKRMAITSARKALDDARKKKTGTTSPSRAKARKAAKEGEQ
jgi:Holliday junction resolvase RusA-like endonuclease